MSQNIPDSIRNKVSERANYRCEYCRRLETDSFIRYQIDHIISRKHGGNTSLENLAYSCSICNNAKGSDLSSFIDKGEKIIRLFNPRKDNWSDHFEIEHNLIKGKTDIGEVTTKLLKMNDIDRILERIDLINAGLFP